MMTADHGTSRYLLYKKQRDKQVTPTTGSGTGDYKPMYQMKNITTQDQSRTVTKPMYNMMDKGGSPSKGGCGCGDDDRPKHKMMNHKIGLLYDKNKR